MFILDTDVVAELRKAKSGKADRGVASWAATVPTGSLFLSAITVMELDAGIRQVEHHTPPYGNTLRIWLEHQVLPAFAGRVLPVDSAVAQRCATLETPGHRNALIGATALVHGMTVVTRHTAGFEPTGVRLLNPWSLEGVAA